MVECCRCQQQNALIVMALYNNIIQLLETLNNVSKHFSSPLNAFSSNTASSVITLRRFARALLCGAALTLFRTRRSRYSSRLASSKFRYPCDRQFLPPVVSLQTLDPFPQETVDVHGLT